MVLKFSSQALQHSYSGSVSSFLLYSYDTKIKYLSFWVNNGSHYAVLASLELTVQIRNASNSQRFNLSCLQSIGIKDTNTFHVETLIKVAWLGLLAMGISSDSISCSQGTKILVSCKILIFRQQSGYVKQVLLLFPNTTRSSSISGFQKQEGMS